MGKQVDPTRHQPTWLETQEQNIIFWVLVWQWRDWRKYIEKVNKEMPDIVKKKW